MTAAQAAGAASHTVVGFFFHCRVSWPQTSIEKVLFDVE